MKQIASSSALPIRATLASVFLFTLLSLTAREAEAADAGIHTAVDVVCGEQPAGYDPSSIEISIGNEPMSGMFTVVAPGTHNLRILTSTPGWVVKEIKYLDIAGGRGLETYNPNVSEVNLPLVFTARPSTSSASSLNIVIETCASVAPPPQQSGEKCPDDVINAHNSLLQEAAYLRGQIALYQARPALFDGTREAIDLGISKLEQATVDGATKASMASLDDPRWNSIVSSLRKASAATASIRKNLPATSVAMIARLEQQRTETGSRIFQVRERAEALGCKLDIPREPPPSVTEAGQKPRLVGSIQIDDRDTAVMLHVGETVMLNIPKIAAHPIYGPQLHKKIKFGDSPLPPLDDGTVASATPSGTSQPAPGISTPEATVTPERTAWLVHRDAASALTFIYVGEGSVTVTPRRGAALQVNAGEAAWATAAGAQILEAGASGTTAATPPPPTPIGTGTWTPWLNRDAPEGTADYEAFNEMKASVPCDKPLAVECRTAADQRDYRAAGQRYKCSMDEPDPGGICLNSENPAGCLDYEVRFLCPGEGTAGTSDGELPVPPYGTPEPSPNVAGMALQGGQRRVAYGELINVPFFLINAADVANVNFEVRYDANIARPEGTIGKGNLIDNALFSSNPKQSGVLLAGFAQTRGVSGTGTVLNVPFRAVGKPGDRTRLELIVTTINDAQGGVPKIERIPGEIAIVDTDGRFPPGAGGGDGPGAGGPGAAGPGAGGPGAAGPGADGLVTGDCDGDGRLTALDARCALEMSVQLTPVRIILDIDNSKDVTSRDAALILQKAVGR